MKIALIGYGKMGQIIERIALERGHTITGISTTSKPIEEVDFQNVDVAIEFTTPDFAVQHIEYCVDQGTPVVVGTTAWNDDLDAVKEYVTRHQGSLLYASNFSVGVNIFFDLNRRLAKLMEHQPSYTPSIEETHHLQKLDAPSGTAISLANDMLFESDRFSSWVHHENKAYSAPEGQIALTSYRREGVPGTHKITYTSAIDTIEMTHTAHNREGFALGAVLAAEWIVGKRGIYTMQDVIKL
ncbi:MAG: 4-hydroxy-tetrahydrodipicolinate reductase [Bacteroidetes bacterium RIFCSPHIGHO2_02_FULL_44_7]|nr:MAG: 4-hydroxy-tetrahydrodipicolinate reductase [Bacteroidetes bacterium RIFCSPHIGHO2_02_FULL_44_7]